MGDRTTGKGYAQTLIALSEGAVNLSTLKYYTPKGESLANVGITPDVEVSLSEEALYNFYSLTPEQDAQLMKAIEILKEELGITEEPQADTEVTAEPVGETQEPTEE